MARYDRTIPPGGEGKITLEVNTKNLQGNLSKTARVTTNDLKHPQITIAMKGKIWVPISMHPRFARLNGVLGDHIERVVTLRAEKEEHLTVKLTSVSIPDKISVDIHEVDKGRSFQVKIKNKAGKQTTFNGHVKLATNYEDKPELVIRVAGNIRPALEIRPKVMQFGRMSQDSIDKARKRTTLLKRLVTMRLHRGNDLQIEKVELDKRLFTATFKEARAGTVFQIYVEPKFDKLKMGKNEDNLRVYTNQKGYQMVEIPVIFEVM